MRGNSGTAEAGLSRAEKNTIVTATIVGSLLVALLIYFLFVRDYWESQHRVEISSLYRNAHVEAATGHLSDADDHFHDLFVLVGNRRVRDEVLRQEIESAHTESANVTTQIAADVAKTHHQEDERRRLVSETARRRAEEEMVAQKRADEDARIAAQVAHDRLVAARLSEKIAAQQKEAVARQAAIDVAPRVISGAAWITQGDGTNLDLRDMTLMVLQPIASKQLFIETFATLVQSLDNETQAVQRMRTVRQGTGSTEILDNSLTALKTMRDSVVSQSLQPQLATTDIFASIRAVNAIQDISGRMLARDLGNREMQDESSNYKQVKHDRLWDAIVAKLSLGHAATDANGRFAIQFGKGNYVIYARSQSDAWIAEWAIPVDTTAPGSTELNLDNQNASIVNRWK